MNSKYVYTDAAGATVGTQRPLTANDARSRGMTPQSGPEGVYAVIGLDGEKRHTIGSMEGLFTEIMETVQVLVKTIEKNKFTDITVEHRLIGT